MKALSSSIINIILVFGMTAFIFFSVFGLSFSMPVGPDGHMEACPFMDTAVCQMSPFEHISAWQNMFTATTTLNIMILLLALFAVLVFASLFGRQEYPEIQAPLKYLYRKFLYLKSPLQEAFSRGILHSKAY